METSTTVFPNPRQTGKSTLHAEYIRNGVLPDLRHLVADSPYVVHDSLAAKLRKVMSPHTCTKHYLDRIRGTVKFDKRNFTNDSYVLDSYIRSHVNHDELNRLK